MSIAIPGIGTLLKRGDGGVGAGTKASKTIGTSNQQLKVLAKSAGTYGNSKSFGILVSGNNTAFSISVSSTSVVVTSATDGSAAATTTVLQAIAALYANSTFDQYFDATVGTGNGSGVLVAGATAALSGGAEGAEIFTLVPGVIDLGGPNRSRELIDVTSHDSPNLYREFIVGLKDGGAISGELNYKPSDAQHLGMNSDYENDVLRNWTVTFRDNTVVACAAYVESFEITSAIDQQLKASFSLKITGAVTITPP